MHWYGILHKQNDINLPISLILTAMYINCTQRRTEDWEREREREKERENTEDWERERGLEKGYKKRWLWLRLVFNFFFVNNFQQITSSYLPVRMWNVAFTLVNTQGIQHCNQVNIFIYHSLTLASRLWKRGMPPKFAYFVLLISSLFNSLCVWILFQNALVPVSHTCFRLIYFLKHF